MDDKGQDKKKKQFNRPPEFRSEVVLPYSADLGETLKRILEGHRIRTIFKPIIKLSTVLASRKDVVPASKRRGVVNEIPCGNCEHSYIGETKRSLSTRLKEHHKDTLPGNTLKSTSVSVCFRGISRFPIKNLLIDSLLTPIMESTYLPRNILKNPEKTALTKHAAQNGHTFSWEYAHVLHHVNSYHTRIFLESLYIESLNLCRIF